MSDSDSSHAVHHPDPLHRFLDISRRFFGLDKPSPLTDSAPVDRHPDLDDQRRSPDQDADEQ